MAKRHPKPGDLVCAKTTDDALIKRGSCGIIEGMESKKKKKYMVTFNPSPMPWWEGKAITSSGGPSREINIKYMKDTGKSRKQSFHTFESKYGGYTGAGGAVVIKKKVNVFEIDLQKVKR